LIPLLQFLETLSSEITETEITENDFRGVEEMKSAAVMTAEEKSLCLHVNIGGVIGEGGNLIGEEDCGGVEMFTDAVSNYSSKLLDLFLLHLNLMIS
jgi:hypothetical protein